MSNTKRQELINKLSMIGYHAKKEDKNSIFLCIAYLYRTTDEKAIIIENHVNDILNNSAIWDSSIVYKIV